MSRKALSGNTDKEITILYEDENFLVLNKPSGLAAHSDGRTKEPTLADWILKKYPGLADVGESLVLSDEKKILRPGIVHRIDRETSGVLAVAKNQKSFGYLKKQFQDRKVKKIYEAFVFGELKNDEGKIDRPIAKSRKDFRLWSAQRGARGKEREALTLYRTLARGGGVSFVEVEPKTGRTHQIRVHFKAINYPIVCDRLYAPRRGTALGFERLALHAKSLEFESPDGKKIKVEAPYPKDFENAIKIIKKNPKSE